MNHSQERLDRASSLGRIYAAHPSVAAVLVGGSVARRLADAQSDLELGVFWHSPPSDEERAALLNAAGVERPRPFPYFPDEDLWLDQGAFQGVRLDLIHRTVEGVQRGIARVLERHEAELHALNALAVLGYGLPLAGEALLDQWRGQVANYPDPLRTAVIDRHLEPTPTAWLLGHVERREWLLLYERFGRDQKQLLMVLMALNGVYVPHAEFKWMSALEAALPVAPADLTARLGQVLTGPPEEGVEVLRALWEETYDLVEQRFPELEHIAKARRWLARPAERFGPEATG